MKKIVVPGGLCILALIAYAALRFTGGSVIHDEGYTYFLTFLFACLSIVGVRGAGFVFFDILYFERTKREAPGLLRMLFSLVMYGICIILIFSLVLKKDLTGILATSAVLSVVFGLALQDTLGNFFAGASLHIEQLFKIGDSIRIHDTVGKVEAVSWRTTTVRTNNNSIFTLPNSLIARERIEIYHYGQLHRHPLDFTAPYSISPQTVIQVVLNAARTIPDISDETKPTARITGFGDSSINYELLYWAHDYMRVQDINSQLRERIWYAFRRDNIDIPFPVRHLVIERRKSTPNEENQEVDYRKVIAQVGIFEPLSQSEKDSILASNGVAVFAPGESMVSFGDMGDSMFIIGRGRAEVQVPGNGTPNTVAVLEAGNFFGEMSLFSGEPRSADVIALEEIEVLEIKKGTIQKLLFKNDKLAEAFSRKVTQRQIALAKHADSCREEEIFEEQGKLLQRIKRFFSMS